MVAIFLDRIARDERPTVYGFGEPTRDYVHVFDVATAFVVAARSEGGTFNVGTGVETPVRAVWDVLRSEADSSLEAELQPLRPGELDRSALDASLIERELGWRPTIDVERGLRETARVWAA